MRVSRLGKLLLAAAGAAGVLLAPAANVGAEFQCITTYYEDDTCETVCIYWDSQGKPAGHLRCRCC